MSDPIMSESILLDALDCDTSIDNAGRLQAAALMSVVNAFDRRVERDSFISLVMAAMGLHSQIAKAFMINSVRETHQKLGYFDEFETALKNTHHDILRLAVAAHSTVHEAAKKVTACPTSQDKIH